MSHTVNFNSNSPQDTERLAGAFARTVRPGDIVSLEGDLGAGKTFFTRAFARELGVTERVTSPTFVLQKVHRIPAGPIRAIVHYDVYRMESYAELADIGFEDLLEDNVTFVEWGDRFAGQYPASPIRIKIRVEGEQSRTFQIDFPDEERASALAAMM